jgi:hypothetical protein
MSVILISGLYRQRGEVCGKLGLQGQADGTTWTRELRRFRGGIVSLFRAAGPTCHSERFQAITVTTVPTTTLVPAGGLRLMMS